MVRKCALQAPSGREMADRQAILRESIAAGLNGYQAKIIILYGYVKTVRILLNFLVDLCKRSLIYIHITPLICINIRYIYIYMHEYT